MAGRFDRLRSWFPVESSEPSIDDIDDETFDRAAEILEANGDEIGRAHV